MARPSTAATQAGNGYNGSLARVRL
jgi:hypothetical protein